MERNGTERIATENQTTQRNGRKHLYLCDCVTQSLCNRHKLNTKGTEGNGTDRKKRLNNEILFHYRRTCCMSGQ